MEGEGWFKGDTKVTRCGDREHGEPSMEREKLRVDLMRDLGTVMMTSDLSQLSLRKLA